MILIRIIKIFTKSSGINCSVIFCYFLIIYIFSNHKQWDRFFSNNVSIILCLNILKVDLDSKLVYKIAFMQETNRFGVDFHIFGIDITMSWQKFYEKIWYYQKRLKKTGLFHLPIKNNFESWRWKPTHWCNLCCNEWCNVNTLCLTHRSYMNLGWI